jgi:hypothetical protein
MSDPIPWRKEADRLHEEGVALSDAGDSEGALAKYREALALDLNRPSTLYNVGLIYKRRAAWVESFRFNKLAHALKPDDEPSAWNLAIAATALHDWNTARAVWGALRPTVGPGDDFGVMPVRLNPQDDAEVVWARRVSPVLAQLISIPFAESAFRYRDFVLLDREPVGYRTQKGREYPVLNVLDLVKPSRFYSMYEASLTAPERADLEALKALCADAGIAFEDWSESVRFICRACSEGRPREHHDAGDRDESWIAQRSVALATTWDAQIESVLDTWIRKDRIVRLAPTGSSTGARRWAKRAARDRAGRAVEIGPRPCATCDTTLTMPTAPDHNQPLTTRRAPALDPKADSTHGGAARPGSP